MSRLSLSDADRDVRNWLIGQVQAVGCTVKVDQMGNIFATRPGKNGDAQPPTAMGSHLDTQPSGGRYDGILGVQSALEVMRTLHENGHETEFDVALVNWTNEEGARFPKITVASGVWAEAIPLEEGWACQEVPSLSTTSELRNMKQELERIGFLGEVPCSWRANPLAAHFEVHIEQGPVLEATGRKIGAVTGSQGYQWHEITVKGRDCHAGTTPLHLRADALLVASRMVTSVSEIAAKHSGLATVGVISAGPGSVNTIPHTATFTLDARHHDGQALDAMILDIRSEFDRIAQNRGALPVEVAWKMLASSAPAIFDPQCISAVEEGATAALSGLAHKEPGESLLMRMVSGASHDSSYTSLRCPTGMIFTYTRAGRSHTPDEYCPPEDCILGAQTLLEAVLRFDRARASA